MRTCDYTSRTKSTPGKKTATRQFVASAFLIGVLTLSSPCHAGNISHNFTGTVDYVSHSGTGSVPFGIGASVTGSYFYESATAFSGLTNGSSGFSEYDNAQTGIYFNVNGYYDYGHSQANPLYNFSYANSNSVYFGPSTTPAEYLVYQTGSLAYESDGLHTIGENVTYGGSTGMLSSYSPSTLNGLSVDYSKVDAKDYASVSFQTYTQYNGGFTEFTFIHVHMTSVDGVQLGTSSSPPVDPTTPTPPPTSSVPEPSTFALIGLGGIGLAIASNRQRRTASNSRTAEFC